PLDDRDRVCEDTARQDDAELLPAITGEEVVGAQHAPPCPGGLLQQAIPGLVAAAVVVALEAIEVEHRDAERRAATPGSRDLARELLLPGPPVGEPGQLVRACDPLRPPEELGATDRNRRGGREHV